MASKRVENILCLFLINLRISLQKNVMFYVDRVHDVESIKKKRTINLEKRTVEINQTEKSKNNKKKKIKNLNKETRE